MRNRIKDGKRIVIKVGTSTLTYDNGSINLTRIEKLSRVISDLCNMGKEVVLVSSGAIGVGCGKLRLPKKPESIREKQAVAAVGQCELMHIYSKFFGEYSHVVAQVLLTRDVLENSRMKENVCNTFETLLQQGIIPIVNENDAISSDEIENIHNFGDNDNLSAIVSTLVNADTLIILSDIDGFYDCDPRSNPNCKMLKEIYEITEEIEQCAGGAGTNRGTGGMKTKLSAAKVANCQGIDMILANGEKPEILTEILEGKDIGTMFVAKRGEQLMSELIIKGEKAKKASYVLGIATTEEKNKALYKISELLIDKTAEILEANKKDLEAAMAKGTSKAMLDRLRLDEKRVADIANGVKEIIALDDPVGEVTSMFKRGNGLRIGVQRVPLGVIGIIYEARPNVTVDAAALCLKSGNVVILRGGSEAINSNLKIVEVINKALTSCGLPEGVVQLLEDTSRETAREFMRLNKYLDVLIPRGGANLIRTVVENSTVPVIETGVGNCHIYIDSECDLEMGKNIIVNAKTSRPAVCNAAESLLVHEAVAEKFLPLALGELMQRGVEIRGCEKTKAIISEINEATEEDWGREYLDYILSVKVVKDIDEAIEHINQYGTKHSEAIVTTNYFNSEKFLQRVDAAAVYVNASTRFTDGGEFGFGAEIGISTQKLHARGPMGLKELTTNKYIIYGTGQIR